MKNGWTTRPLAALCEFQRGLTYAKGDEVEASKNVVLRANNIDLATNRLDLSDLRHICDKVTVPASKVVRPNSLIICTASGSKTHLGKVAFIDDDYGYAFGGFMGQITPGPELLPKFLFYLMTSEAYKAFIAALSDGANINNLKFEQLGKLEVPLPPLPEQRRIVGVLDEAFAGLATAQANAERNLQNARAVFESHLQSVFTHGGRGWVDKRLEDVCVLQRGFDLPTRERIAGDFPLVSSGGVIDTHHEGPVPGPGVVTGRSGSIGSVFFVESNFWPLNTTLYVKDFHGNHPRFCFWLLRHLDLSRFASGAGVPTLNRNSVHEERAAIPSSIASQQAVASELDALATQTQRLARKYEQTQARLAALKKSLLHQAFNGEL